MSKTTKCQVCGKEYELCSTCNDQRQLKPWKLHTDTSEHFKIFQILRAYGTGVYNTQQTKKALQNVDLSDKESYLDHIKKIINKIMNSEPEVKKSKKNSKITKTNDKK